MKLVELSTNSDVEYKIQGYLSGHFCIFFV